MNKFEKEKLNSITNEIKALREVLEISNKNNLKIKGIKYYEDSINSIEEIYEIFEHYDEDIIFDMNLNINFSKNNEILFNISAETNKYNHLNLEIYNISNINNFKETFNKINNENKQKEKLYLEIEKKEKEEKIKAEEHEKKIKIELRNIILSQIQIPIKVIEFSNNKTYRRHKSKKEKTYAIHFKNQNILKKIAKENNFDIFFKEDSHPIFCIEIKYNNEIFYNIFNEDDFDKKYIEKERTFYFR